MEGSSIAIKGSAYCFFAFDVADSIALASIPAELRPHRVQIAHRHPAPEYVEYADPPVEIALGERQVELGGRTLRATVVARLFDFGAVSISYLLPLPVGHRWVVEAGVLCQPQLLLCQETFA